MASSVQQEIVGFYVPEMTIDRILRCDIRELDGE